MTRGQTGEDPNGAVRGSTPRNKDRRRRRRRRADGAGAAVTLDAQSPAKTPTPTYKHLRRRVLPLRRRSRFQNIIVFSSLT